MKDSLETGGVDKPIHSAWGKVSPPAAPPKEVFKAPDETVGLSREGMYRIMGGYEKTPETSPFREKADTRVAKKTEAPWDTRPKTTLTEHIREPSKVATELPLKTPGGDEMYRLPRRLPEEDPRSLYDSRPPHDHMYRLPATGERGGHSGPKTWMPKPDDPWT